MTTEARERLSKRLTRVIGEIPMMNSRDQANAALDAILTDYDDLAAVANWPELLAAGERVGKLTNVLGFAPADCTNACGEGPCNCSGKWRGSGYDTVERTGVRTLADQPNGADAPTEQEEATDGTTTGH